MGSCEGAATGFAVLNVRTAVECCSTHMLCPSLIMPLIRCG